MTGPARTSSEARLARRRSACRRKPVPPASCRRRRHRTTRRSAISGSSARQFPKELRLVPKLASGVDPLFRRGDSCLGRKPAQDGPRPAGTSLPSCVAQKTSAVPSWCACGHGCGRAGRSALESRLPSSRTTPTTQGSFRGWRRAVEPCVCLALQLRGAPGPRLDQQKPARACSPCGGRPGRGGGRGRGQGPPAHTQRANADGGESLERLYRYTRAATRD